MFFIILHNFTINKLYDFIFWILIFKMKKNHSIMLALSKDTLI